MSVKQKGNFVPAHRLWTNLDRRVYEQIVDGTELDAWGHVYMKCMHLTRRDSHFDVAISGATGRAVR